MKQKELFAKKLIVLVFLFFILFPAFLKCAEEGVKPGEQALILKLEEAKNKIEQLNKEKNDLIQKGATAEEIQRKTNEISAVQRSAIQSIEVSQPPAPPNQVARAGNVPPPLKLSPEDQAEIQSLIEKRRTMVLGGATHKDVQEITQKIKQILNRGFQQEPPSPLPVHPPAPISPEHGTPSK